MAKIRDILKLFFLVSRNLFGVNKRLDNVLKEAAEKQKAKEEVKEEAEPPVNMKGLEGLPPALVKKILEKEKAKQLKKMTETPGDKKEVLMLEDLQTVRRSNILLGVLMTFEFP